MKKFQKMIAILAIIALSSTVLAGCKQEPAQDQEEDKTNEEVVKDETPKGNVALADEFAKWEEVDLSYTPQVEPYEIESDLSNVQIVENIYIPDNIKESLAENGFVVAPSWNSEFFSIYEDNRYEFVPNFITTDSVLHTYHLYFDFLLRSLEENELNATALDLSEGMLKEAKEFKTELKGTEWENAALRMEEFFVVALYLADDYDEDLGELSKAEIELIEAHGGITGSPLMNYENDADLYREDYSQYITRGHYNKSELLQKYFKYMMWYGRLNFRLNSEEETKTALLMVSVLDNNPDLLKKWLALYEPINFFVGESDDLIFFDYSDLAHEVYGDDLSVSVLSADSAKLTKFMTQGAATLRNPGINSMPILGPILGGDEEDRTTQTKGFRFLGQRFTIDAFVFQKLICRDVGNKDGTMPCPASDEDGNLISRMLPMALDIPAVFGSKVAFEILEDLGETEYKGYTENMQKLQIGIEKLPQSMWTSNLYWSWLYTLKSLLKDYGEGYPSFMLSDEWKKKELVTFLGSYTELKHDTILYAKQVYAEMGGAFYEEIDDRGYVEPNPELYARLASLTKLMNDGLEARDILSSANEEQLEKLYDLLSELKDISIKELENTPLTDDEYEFIRAYGGSLEHFWYETFTEEEKNEGKQALLNGNPAAIVADIATDPNGFVLEEGTGFVDNIYVVFPIDGELKVGMGGVFSHFEFPWPMDDRLTDEKWREMLIDLDDEYDIQRADWQDSFVIVREYE